jgi:hypothetical protein
LGSSILHRVFSHSGIAAQDQACQEVKRILASREPGVERHPLLLLRTLLGVVLSARDSYQSSNHFVLYFAALYLSLEKHAPGGVHSLEPADGPKAAGVPRFNR